ncbi:MAG: pyrroloquinoline quinone biosynthesis peptide chaperone PqqD [Acidobacteriaceae bacterium]|nr:pyrroloquinoline quinone biosynthesis peptide chaperone PqqD [Acidobacteriaceae bacterium]MBV8572912.1 pyrroloquinoline quinone biosynthesis peptide chaperone PqqD [Acidobacteriaceae bacterium]
MTAREGRPVLKPGCRLSAAGDVLLIPEGALRLQGPASRIVEACDGTRTVEEIVATLLKQFPGADETKVSQETASFLNRLSERGVLEFV